MIDINIEIDGLGDFHGFYTALDIFLDHLETHTHIPSDRMKPSHNFEGCGLALLQ